MTLINTDDVRAVIGEVPDSQDQLLGDCIDAITKVIEDIVGPVESGTRTATFDGGGGSVVLPSAAATVTSVTVNGNAVNYTANAAAGVVYGGTSAAPFAYLPGIQNVVVSYTVGSDDVPANVKFAARELLRVWWQQSMQANRPAWTDADEGDDAPSSGFTVPKWVITLCAANMRAPGVG